MRQRLFLPQSKLRGFKAGKVGPKDGTDSSLGCLCWFSSILFLATTTSCHFEFELLPERGVQRKDAGDVLELPVPSGGRFYVRGEEGVSARHAASDCVQVRHE